MEGPATVVRARSPPASASTQLSVSFSVQAISPAVSPAGSPERHHVDGLALAAGGGKARRRGHQHPQVGFDIYPVPDPRGGPIVLQDDEYCRSILISHNRRDPAALNLTYALVDGLRRGVDPETGQPLSVHCHKDSRRVELWLDKEQLAERGGDDWNEPILRSMREGVATIFCLGNAFCGSANCVREVKWAVRQGFATIPVFLERLCRDEESFSNWKRQRAAVPGGPESLLDENARSFREWRVKADGVAFYMEELQGVPADCFALFDWTCARCQGTRDVACVECAEWSIAVAREGSGLKLLDAARRLGKYVDRAVDEAMRSGMSQTPSGHQTWSAPATTRSATTSSEPAAHSKPRLEPQPEPQKEPVPPQQEQSPAAASAAADVLPLTGVYSSVPFQQDVDFPPGIFSYASGTADGNGEAHMWAVANGLRTRGISTYNGRMVKAGQNWRVEWLGILDRATFAIIIPSDAYWKSGSCVDEVRAILEKKIPVFLLRGDVGFKGRVPHGNFLGDTTDEIKLAGFFRNSKELTTNCLPGPEAPPFQDDNDANCEALCVRICQTVPNFAPSPLAVMPAPAAERGSETVDSHSESQAESQPEPDVQNPQQPLTPASDPTQVLKRERIGLLQTTSTRTHIISCPFNDTEGVAAAKRVATRYANVDSEYCYYPNEDCPQTPGQQGGVEGRAKSWLAVWVKIARNVKKTGGTVFVVHRLDGEGPYGCDEKGPGSLDGQAQEGEVAIATDLGCNIEWIGYAGLSVCLRSYAPTGTPPPSAILLTRQALKAIGHRVSLRTDTCDNLPASAGESSQHRQEWKKQCKEADYVVNLLTVPYICDQVCVDDWCAANDVARGEVLDVVLGGEAVLARILDLDGDLHDGQRIVDGLASAPSQVICVEDGDPSIATRILAAMGMSFAEHEAMSTLELQWPDGSVDVDGEISLSVLEEVKQAALDALDARIEQIEVGVNMYHKDQLTLDVQVLPSWFESMGSYTDGDSSVVDEVFEDQKDSLKHQLTALLRERVLNGSLVEVQIIRGSVRVVFDGLPRWAATVLASICLGGDTVETGIEADHFNSDFGRRLCAILEDQCTIHFAAPRTVLLDGVPQQLYVSPTVLARPIKDLGDPPQGLGPALSTYTLNDFDEDLYPLDKDEEGMTEMDKVRSLVQQGQLLTDHLLNRYNIRSPVQAAADCERRQQLQQRGGTTAAAAAAEPPPVPIEDKMDVALLGRYLAKTAKENSTIADLMSSKKLDIMRQCVNVSVKCMDINNGSLTQDSVHAICDCARLDVGMRVEAYLWGQWIGARVQMVSERELELMVSSDRDTIGEHWSKGSQSPEGDAKGSFIADATGNLEWKGVLVADTVDGTQTNINTTLDHPSFAGTRAATITIQGVTASATGTVRLRRDICGPEPEPEPETESETEPEPRLYVAEATTGGRYRIQLDPNTVSRMTIFKKSMTDDEDTDENYRNDENNARRTMSDELMSDALRRCAESEGIPLSDLINKEKDAIFALLRSRSRVVDGAQLEFRFDVQCPTRELIVRAPHSVVSRKPVLVTGAAASGKSTLTKQCLHVLAKASIDALAGIEWTVPYRVTVIDICRAIENEQWAPQDDILGLYITRSEGEFAPVLLAAREKQRLVLILDGIDEAGAARSVIEPYVAQKLRREVFLCLTGRENGVSDGFRREFQAHFLSMHIEALTQDQQRHIIEGRLGEMQVDGATLASRVDAFVEQLTRMADLAATPMLLNLMLSEYMLHEGEGKQISFDGRIVTGQDEYVASFPGVEKRAWDRVTTVLEDKSVACVWLPPDSDLQGRHYADHKNEGRCFCQSFLYHDLPAHVLAQDPFKMIMHESDVYIGNGVPTVGKKVEVKFETPIERWWICSVLDVDTMTKRVLIKSDGRTDLEAEWLTLDDARLNRTGERKTDQQVGQAPFGCMWFHGWSQNVHKAERQGQQATVIFKKGHRGDRTLTGLGASQQKELQYLEENFARYSGGHGWKELDAAEFETEYTMSRVQIYKSATDAMIRQQEKVRLERCAICFEACNDQEANRFVPIDESGTLARVSSAWRAACGHVFHVQCIENWLASTSVNARTCPVCRQEARAADKMDVERVHKFLEELAYASHTRNSSEIRKFGDAIFECTQTKGNVSMWSGTIKPSVQQSHFPLLCWEPDSSEADNFLFSHLSFQEYYCACYLARCMRDQKRAPADIGATARHFVTVAQNNLLASDRYQTVVQLCVELFDKGDQEDTLQSFCGELLALYRVDQTVSVHSNLSAAPSVTTVMSLVQSVRDVTRLDFLCSGLTPTSVQELARWLATPTMTTVVEVDISQNNIETAGAEALTKVFPGSSLQWIVIGAKSTRVPIHNSEVTALNFQGQSLGPADVIVIAASMSTNTSVVEIDLSGQPLTGATRKYSHLPWENIDTQMDSFIALCASLGKVQKISLDDCALGPASMAELAKAVSSANAFVASISLSGNMISGSTDVGSSYASIEYDLDLSGIIALGEAAAISKTLTSIDLSNCGIAAKGIAEVTKFISANSSIASISLTGNMITGSTDIGYIGYSYAKYDLDLSGIIAFGKVAAVSKTLTSIDLSDCGIAAAGIAEVAKFMSAGAALAEVVLDGCPLTGATPRHGDAKKFGWENTDLQMEGFVALCGVVGKLEKVSLVNCGLGPVSAGELAKAIGSDGAAVKEIVLDQQPISGSTVQLGDFRHGIKQIDASLFGFQLLCDALASSPIQIISMKSCLLGPQAIALLADTIRVTTTIASLTLDSNGIFGEFDVNGFLKKADKFLPKIQPLLDALKTSSIVSLSLCNTGMGPKGAAAVRAAAPDGCEVVW